MLIDSSPLNKKKSCNHNSRHPSKEFSLTKLIGGAGQNGLLLLSFCRTLKKSLISDIAVVRFIPVPLVDARSLYLCAIYMVLVREP